MVLRLRDVESGRLDGLMSKKTHSSERSNLLGTLLDLCTIHQKSAICRMDEGLTNVGFHWESAEGKTAVICVFLVLLENFIGFDVVPRTARDQVDSPAACAGSGGKCPFGRTDLPVKWEDKREGSKLIPNTYYLGNPCSNEPLAATFPREQNRKDLKLGSRRSFRKIHLERAPRTLYDYVSYPAQAVSAAKRESVV